MKFADVIGHEALKSVLRKSVDGGRVSHAQMFSGLCGWGALPLALAYVQYLNCTNRHDGDSCGECPSCRKTAALMHPDLHFIFPANTPKGSPSSKYISDNFIDKWRGIFARTGGYFDEQEWYGELGIDNKQGLIPRRDTDEIIKKLSYKAFEAEYKAVIIWLPERFHETAANALLKILEEPWEKTLFLLVSQEPYKLLPTIISRVQQTEVGRTGEDEMRRYAESLGLVGDRAATAAHLADGNVLALRRLAAGEEGGTDENFGRFAELMRLCYSNNHLKLIDWAESLAKEGREMQKRFFEYAVGMLREVYMISAGVEGVGYLWGEEKEFARKFAPFIGNGNIEAFVGEMEKALLHIRQNGNPKIVLVHFVLSVSKFIVRR